MSLYAQGKTCPQLGENNLKKYLGLIPVALFALLLGCGGGGGGGGGGTTNTTGSCVVNFTAGDTTAQPGDTILGQVVNTQGCPLANVSVRIYTAADVVQAIATTNADGYWRASVNSNAVKADVDGATLTNAYHKGYRYGTEYFTAATVSPSVTCNVPLPPIVGGTLTPMPNHAFVFWASTLPPPPPPLGCQP